MSNWRQLKLRKHSMKPYINHTKSYTNIGDILLNVLTLKLTLCSSLWAGTHPSQFHTAQMGCEDPPHCRITITDYSLHQEALVTERTELLSS